MPQSAYQKPSLAAEDIVKHASWGIARITEITSGVEPRVFLQFEDGNKRDMSLTLAMTALTKFPEDGLQVSLSRNRQALLHWENEAPLKLVALALIDLSRAGKPSDIRKVLEGSRLLSTRWDSWWKRVQPILRQSPAFRLRHDRAYELTVHPEQVPAAPLPSIGKKKEAALSKPQLMELVNRVERAELKFEEIDGSKAKHQVAKELTKRAAKSAPTKELIMSSLSGPLIPARIMLQEYTKNSDTQDTLAAMQSLLEHIIRLVSSTEIADVKDLTEHVNAKVNLFKDNLKMALLRQDSTSQNEPLNVLTHRLVYLALELSEATPTSWRTDAAGVVTESLSNIAVVQPTVLNAVGRDLGTGQTGLDARAGVAEGLAKVIPAEKRDDAIRRLLAGSLPISIDLTDRLIQGLLSRHVFAIWLADNVGDIVRMANQDAPEVMRHLLERVGARIGHEELGSYIRFAAAVTLATTSSEFTIPDIGAKRIEEWARSIDLDISRDTSASSQAVLNLIVLAIKSRMKREQDDWETIRQSLQSEIAGLQQQASKGEETIGRLESIIEELKSSFRIPESWIEFRAKKDILERLGLLYQEIFASWAKDRDNANLRRIIQQIETILTKNNVSIFGDPGSIVTYNPSEYEFIRGTDTSENEVRVEYPGFLWKDPGRNNIVLVRARVARKGGANEM